MTLLSAIGLSTVSWLCYNFYVHHLSEISTQYPYHASSLDRRRKVAKAIAVASCLASLVVVYFT